MSHINKYLSPVSKMFASILLLFFFSASSLSLSHYENISLLIEWLEEHGSLINTERIEVRESPLGGKGIFLIGGEVETGPAINIEGEITQELLESRDPLFLEIPYALFFHPFSPYLSPLTHDCITLLSQFHRGRGGEFYENLLNIALALEMRNESSFFRPFFNTISIGGSFGIRMSKEDILVLDEEHQDTIGRFQQYYENYLTGFNSALLGVFNNESMLLSRDEYFMSCSLTGSRSFGQEGKMLPHTPSIYRESHVPVLIPFFDLVNHRGLPRENRYFHTEREGAFFIRWWPSFVSEVQSPGREQFISYHGPLAPGDYNEQVFYGFSSHEKCLNE